MRINQYDMLSRFHRILERDSQTGRQSDMDGRTDKLLYQYHASVC